MAPHGPCRPAETGNGWRDHITDGGGGQPSISWSEPADVRAWPDTYAVNPVPADAQGGAQSVIAGAHSEDGVTAQNFGPFGLHHPKLEAPPPADAVYQPAHYARYVIEPVTFINANKVSFNIGNVIKYALRYDAKDGVQDLRKAIRYLEIEIECIARRRAVADGRRGTPQEIWGPAL